MPPEEPADDSGSGVCRVDGRGGLGAAAGLAPRGTIGACRGVAGRADASVALLAPVPTPSLLPGLALGDRPTGVIGSDDVGAEGVVGSLGVPRNLHKASQAASGEEAPSSSTSSTGEEAPRHSTSGRGEVDTPRILPGAA